MEVLYGRSVYRVETRVEVTGLSDWQECSLRKVTLGQESGHVTDIRL
jgi:hypothetical protein